MLTSASAAQQQQTMTDREICEWVMNTCLAFGAGLATAYIVAGLFLSGVQRNIAAVAGGR